MRTEKERSADDYIEKTIIEIMRYPEDVYRAALAWGAVLTTLYLILEWRNLTDTGGWLTVSVFIVSTLFVTAMAILYRLAENYTHVLRRNRTRLDAVQDTYYIILTTGGARQYVTSDQKDAVREADELMKHGISCTVNVFYDTPGSVIARRDV